MTLEEFQNLWLRARNLEMVREFQEFDRDGDGRLTLEEYQRPMAEFVERFDRTDSQSLGKDDFQRGKHHRRGATGGETPSPQPGEPQSGQPGEPAETQQ